MKRLVRRRSSTRLQRTRSGSRSNRPLSVPKYDRSSQVSLVPTKVTSRLGSSRPTSKTSTMKRPTSAKPSSCHSKSGYSPFLRLPAEVRVCIYRFLLPSQSSKFKLYTDCDSTYTDRKWSVTRSDKRRSSDPCALAILRTNKMIYYEALSVLYSENAFHFIGTNFLPIIDFIRRLSPDAKNLVRQLKITMLPEARHLRADQLELFCRVVHEWLPGLNVLDSDTWVWI